MVGLGPAASSEAEVALSGIGAAAFSYYESIAQARHHSAVAPYAITVVRTETDSPLPITSEQT